MTQNNNNQSFKDGFDNTAPGKGESAKCNREDKIALHFLDQAIGTFGEITHITGNTDICKTRTLVSILASTLSDKAVAQFTTKLHPSRQRILYVSTVHSISELSSIADAVLETVKAYVPKDDIDETRIDFGRMIEIPMEKRVHFFKQLVSSQSPYGIVIIDGINNCIADLNDEKEISDFFDSTRKWVKENDILFITTIRDNDKLTSSFCQELLKSFLYNVIIEDHLPNMDFIAINPSEIKVIYQFGYKVNKNGLPALVEDTESKNDTENLDSFFSLDSASHTQILKEVFEENRKYNFQELLVELNKKYTDKNISTNGYFLLTLVNSLEHDGIIGRDCENKYQLLVRIEDK